MLVNTFHVLIHLYILFNEMSAHIFGLCFNWIVLGFLFFYCQVLRILYIFYILVLSQICLEIYFPLP